MYKSVLSAQVTGRTNWTDHFRTSGLPGSRRQLSHDPPEGDAGDFEKERDVWMRAPWVDWLDFSVAIVAIPKAETAALFRIRNRWLLHQSMNVQKCT